MSTKILSFNKEAPAHLLVAYYNKQGISAFVQRGTQSAEQQDASPLENQTPRDVFDIFIVQQSDVEKAVVVAEDFVKNPNASKFQEAAWDQAQTSFSSGNYLSGLKLQSLSDWKAHIFTHIVGFLCLAVFLFMYLGFSTEIFNALKIQYFSDLSQNHQWWRLFGPNFMHASAVHLISNIVWWWLIASKLERSLGTSALIIFFVVSSLASNVAQLMYSGPNFLGLSGVVYALFGFMWLIGHLRPNWGLNLPNGLVMLMLLWLILGYADVFSMSMANEAHTFGLISGLILALALHQLTGSQKPTR